MKKRNGNGRKDGTPYAARGYVVTEKGWAWLAAENKKRGLPPPVRPRAGMAVALVLMAAALTACGGSKYAIAPADKANTEITLGGQPLISIKPDGVWLWRKKPEEVVQALIAYGTSLNEAAAKCQEQLAAKKPKTAPTPAPKKEPIK